MRWAHRLHPCHSLFGQLGNGCLLLFFVRSSKWQRWPRSFSIRRHSKTKTLPTQHNAYATIHPPTTSVFFLVFSSTFSSFHSFHWVAQKKHTTIPLSIPQHSPSFTFCCLSLFSHFSSFSALPSYLCLLSFSCHSESSSSLSLSLFSLLSSLLCFILIHSSSSTHPSHRKGTEVSLRWYTHSLGTLRCSPHSCCPPLLTHGLF